MLVKKPNQLWLVNMLVLPVILDVTCVCFYFFYSPDESSWHVFNMRRHKVDQEELEMVLLRFFRIPVWFKRLRAIASAFVPMCWLLGLLYCLTAVLISRSHLDLPRLHLEGLYDAKEKAALMHILGFVPDPVLYPHSHHTGQDLPVFVMTIRSDDLRSFHRFLGNFRMHFSQKKLVVYDLGLTKEELDLV